MCATPLTYDEDLSIVDFSQFDRDSLDRGHVLSLLKKALEDFCRTMVYLDELGCQEIPPRIERILGNLTMDMEKCREQFEEMNYYGPRIQALSPCAQSPQGVFFLIFGIGLS